MHVPSLFVALTIAGTINAGPTSSRRVSPRSPIGWKIKGREDTRPGQRPFQVSIQDADQDNGFHFCGGSIYNAYTIITSAWCAHREKPDNLQIVAGEYDMTSPEGNEQVRKVSQVVYHPYFNIVPMEYNIALLKLSTPLVLNNYTQALALPPHQGFHASGKCITSGWGFNDDHSSDTLQQITLPILASEDCYDALDSMHIEHSDNVVCAGFRESEENACIGDDGGPLTCLHNDQPYLAGIQSYDLNCHYKIYPGIYTAVEYYIQWIKNNS